MWPIGASPAHARGAATPAAVRLAAAMSMVGRMISQRRILEYLHTGDGEGRGWTSLAQAWSAVLTSAGVRCAHRVAPSERFPRGDHAGRGSPSRRHRGINEMRVNRWSATIRGL